MCKYHKKGRSSIPKTTAPIPPVLPSKDKDDTPPTHFKIAHVMTWRPPQTFTVEAKFQRYISTELSSVETDILQFWEVSSGLWTTLQPGSLWSRSTGWSTQCCLPSQWTISRSRLHPYLESVFSPQQRRLTLPNKTGWALCLWKHFNYLNFCWRNSASISWKGGWCRKQPWKWGCKIMTLVLSLWVIRYMRWWTAC